MQEAKRYAWVDCMKGIGIFLVALGHIYKDNYVGQWIYSFHMPLFFMLSGFLMGKKDFSWKYGGGNFLIKKSRALLWPFVFFRILLVAYWYVVESGFRELDLGPIWFLLVLFLVETITFPLASRVKSSLIGLLIFTIIFSALFLCLRNVFPFRWLLMWCNANVWFVIGMMIRLLEEKPVIKTKFSMKYTVLLCMGLGGVSALAPLLNGNVSIFSNVTNHFLLYILFGLVGTLMVGLLCRGIIGKSRMLEYLGTYSIIILAVHEPIKRILMKIIMVMGDKMGFAISKESFSSDYLLGFLLCLLVVLCCIPVIKMFVCLKRHTGRVGNAVLAFVK